MAATFDQRLWTIWREERRNAINGSVLDGLRAPHPERRSNHSWRPKQACEALHLPPLFHELRAPLSAERWRAYVK